MFSLKKKDSWETLEHFPVSDGGATRKLERDLLQRLVVIGLRRNHFKLKEDMLILDNTKKFFTVR